MSDPIVKIARRELAAELAPKGMRAGLPKVRLEASHVEYLCRKADLAKHHEALVEELEKALIDYLWSEGCSCCSDSDAHDEAMSRIGVLMGWPRYEDDSGVNWYSRRDELNEAARSLAAADKKDGGGDE